MQGPDRRSSVALWEQERQKWEIYTLWKQELRGRFCFYIFWATTHKLFPNFVHNPQRDSLAYVRSSSRTLFLSSFCDVCHSSYCCLRNIMIINDIDSDLVSVGGWWRAVQSTAFAAELTNPRNRTRGSMVGWEELATVQLSVVLSSIFRHKRSVLSVCGWTGIMSILHEVGVQYLCPST